MLIQNYGLYWLREDVFLGSGNKEGHLKGTRVKAKTTSPVDFRYQQGIYCLYDDNFRLVYVGQAGSGMQQRLMERLKQHMKDPLSDRWTKFSWFGIRAVNKTGKLRAEKTAAHPALSDVLDHIEAILIASAEPPHNRQGGRFGEHVRQYLQYRDNANLGPDATEMVRQLWKKIQNT